MGSSQHLYLVFGGEVLDPTRDDFKNPRKLDIRGIFDSYEDALKAWRAASFQAVDDAYMRYRIVPLG